MELLEKVSKQHNEWVKIATTFGCEYPEDIVQEMYLRVHKYGQKEKILNESGQVNLFYIWSILRNVCGDTNKMNKIEFISLETLYNLKYEENNLCKEEAFNIIEDLIDKETKTWHHYDKMLFDLYRKTGLSMREMSKATKIHHGSIFHTLKRCKKRLQEAVGDDYKDYLNQDFELIK